MIVTVGNLVQPGLLKIGISKKNADFTGNKVWEYADFQQKQKSLSSIALSAISSLLCHVYSHQTN